MKFVKFIISCILNAIGCMTGDVSLSISQTKLAAHGAIALLVLVITVWILIIKCGIDSSGQHKRFFICYAIGIGMLIDVAYFAVAYCISN